MEIDEGHGRVFWGFTQQCEGNVKRGGQEKGAGQLPGALGEGAVLGFGKGGLSPMPGRGGVAKGRGARPPQNWKYTKAWGS